MKPRFIITFLILVCLLLTIIPNAPFHSVNATYVGGLISGNVTWKIENSPYIITSDIMVNNNATLTIQPGVVIRFDGNYSLIVSGSLHAVGNGTSQVTFTSNKPQPSSGDWNTLKFLGTSNNSFVLKYSIIQYALYGVTIQSQQEAVVENSEISYNLYGGINIIGLSNLLIKENVIQRNGDGIVGSGNIFSGLITTNNSINYNNRGGVYVHTDGSASAISNVTFSGNTLSYNRYGIFLYSGKMPSEYSQSSYITNFEIASNSISFGEYGIYLETRSWGSSYPYLPADNSYIYNGIISNNTLFFNRNGIYIYSGGAWYRFVFDIVISGNVVATGRVGMYLGAHHYNLAPFDVTIASNVFSTNEKGIQVFDTVKTNITRNSLAYNGYGVMYVSTKDNIAAFNDIYRNTLYGMHVQNATVNAENNYWGNATGPYHPSNPSGGGNKVNGDGTDLDFKPFATEPIGRINEPPVAKIQVDRRKLPVNQTVTIDASASSDDDHVEWYFFDFGDQTSSNWTKASKVTHVYSSAKVYEIQLLVLDNFGVRSSETTSLAVNVTAGPIRLVVLVDLNSTLLLPGEQLVITVQATDGDYPVPEAPVELSSDKGGAFSQAKGISDINGYFNSTLIPPAVTDQMFLTITANVTKEGYLSGLGQSQVILMPPPRERTSAPDLTLPLGIAVAIITVIVAFVFLKAKKKPKTRRVLKQRKR